MTDEKRYSGVVIRGPDGRLYFVRNAKFKDYQVYDDQVDRVKRVLDDWKDEDFAVSQPEYVAIASLHGRVVNLAGEQTHLDERGDEQGGGEQTAGEETVGEETVGEETGGDASSGGGLPGPETDVDPSGA